MRWNSQGTPSFQNVVFFIVIIGALLLQRGASAGPRQGITSSWSATGVVKPIPRELRRLPEVRWAKLALVAVVGALFVVLPMGWSASGQLLAAFAIVWAIVGVSLVVLTGWGGHISLGQFGIVGVGAVVGGNLVAKAHADLFLLAAGGRRGRRRGRLIVGLPALRIQGLFLAVTTLAFAIALNAYFFNPDNSFSLGPIHAKFSTSCRPTCNDHCSGTASTWSRTTCRTWCAWRSWPWPSWRRSVCGRPGAARGGGHARQPEGGRRRRRADDEREALGLPAGGCDRGHGRRPAGAAAAQARPEHLQPGRQPHRVLHVGDRRPGFHPGRHQRRADLPLPGDDHRPRRPAPGHHRRRPAGRAARDPGRLRPGDAQRARPVPALGGQAPRRARAQPARRPPGRGGGRPRPGRGRPARGRTGRRGPGRRDRTGGERGGE